MISHIVAYSSNKVIGAANQLPWHLVDDLKRFKAITEGNIVVMGRKTYESIGKPLPNRVNIVMTRNKKYSAPGCLTISDFNEAIKLYNNNNMCMYVIGGSEIYANTMNLVNAIYATEIKEPYTGDAYYPDIPKQFAIANKIDKDTYSYVTYIRNNDE